MKNIYTSADVTVHQIKVNDYIVSAWNGTVYGYFKSAAAAIIHANKMSSMDRSSRPFCG